MSALELLSKALAPAGAPAGELAAVEAALGIELPESYKAFMAVSDGCDGSLPHIWVILYPVALVVPQTQSYRDICNAPDAVFIGTDGGTEAFVIDYSGDEPGFGALRYVGGSLEKLMYTAPTFDAFVERLNAG